MDNWLETLIGTAIIGGAIYITGKEAHKNGYNQAMDQVAKNAQESEIARLRAELNEMKAQQKLLG